MVINRFLHRSLLLILKSRSCTVCCVPPSHHRQNLAIRGKKKRKKKRKELYREDLNNKAWGQPKVFFDLLLCSFFFFSPCLPPHQSLKDKQDYTNEGSHAWRGNNFQFTSSTFMNTLSPKGPRRNLFYSLQLPQ